MDHENSIQTEIHEQQDIRPPYLHKLLLIVCLMTAILIGATCAYYLKKGQIIKKSSLPNLTPTITITPRPTLKKSTPDSIVSDSTGNWKIFTSSYYGFQIQFPAKGLNYARPTFETDCGNSIKDMTPYSDLNIIGDIYLDSFFSIYITKVDPAKTLQELINDIKKEYERGSDTSDPSMEDLYTLSALSGTNADAAVAINQKMKSGYTDNVPFSHTIALYKKGGKLFTLIRPMQLGLSCYAPLKGINWDIPNSFKLL